MVDVTRVLKQFSALPRFSDGRIDYHTSDTAAVVNVFVKVGEEILLLKRSDKVLMYKGKWNTVAGYVDEPKPLREKALEELREEIGVLEKDIVSYKEGEPFTFTDSAVGKTWIVHVVLVVLKEKPTIALDWEHTEYRWIKPDELAVFDTIPRLADGLGRVL